MIMAFFGHRGDEDMRRNAAPLPPRGPISSQAVQHLLQVGRAFAAIAPPTLTPPGLAPPRQTLGVPRPRRCKRTLGAVGAGEEDPHGR